MDKAAGAPFYKAALTGIHVRNGRATIGFYAHGAPGASCQIDDVVFTRTK
ncbi:hypothetical protein [Galbibacter pacificus]|uniref:Uncharacterized protein n=1 Tax=Galbibacter pacificus TaxID=2996052 RepID=A0ABT6FRW6_9FLAO|nr:hypothetical protein [Galbibacter pacificus]MDG3582896.1 hypothetical protein [Galbibacter pacificus]MDG3585985.1 hypothetical protein [Galbibacter pacificus]